MGWKEVVEAAEHNVMVVGLKLAENGIGCELDHEAQSSRATFA
jgi:hypothetical protein